MKPELKTKFAKLAYVVGSLMISGIGIYCMVEPLYRKSNATMRKHLESDKFGPFDEAMRKSLGISDLLDESQRNSVLSSRPPDLDFQ